MSPAFHRRCSTYDRRGRTSWHLDIWQYETIVHCAVPSAPKDSVPAARIPWGSSRRRITALFEAQAIRDGTLWHERCGHKPLHETAHVHMEAAREGDIEGEGCSRLFQSRVCGYRRHRQKVQPKLYQHHGRPGLPAPCAPCTPFIPYSRLQEKSAATAREVAERIYEGEPHRVPACKERSSIPRRYISGRRVPARWQRRCATCTHAPTGNRLLQPQTASACR